MEDHSFTCFALNTAILKALDKIGYETPTPVQQAAIPLALQGKDVLVCAQTGTGKTAAFGLPVVDRLVDLDARGPQILVLSPALGPY